MWLLKKGLMVRYGLRTKEERSSIPPYPQGRWKKRLHWSMGFQGRYIGPHPIIHIFIFLYLLFGYMEPFEVGV